MLNFELIRVTKNPDSAQRGILLLDGEPMLATLELPWKNNQPKISCIKEGDYVCQRALNRLTSGGTNLSVTFELMDVPGRTGILIHPGNTVEDTNGCILVGESYDSWGNIQAILRSRIGYKKLIQLVGKEDHFNLRVSHA